MNEQALAFGESGALFGILSLPETHDPSRPTVLIPNTGVDHRIGPGRLHVELARALANSGYASLRLDNAELGDSERVPGRASVAYAPDLRSAMDMLDAQTVSSGYVIIGFNSGAHDAHQAARIDPRIVGTAFIDGYCYSTRRSWLSSALHQLTRVNRHAYIPLRPLSRFTPQSGSLLHGVRTEEIRYFRTPSRRQMQVDVIEFMRRELSLLYVYTAQSEGSYIYATQLLDAFPILRTYPQVTLHHLPALEYRYPCRATRETIIKLLLDWVLALPTRAHSR